MLDSDLAKLYHCTNGTKDINKAVKRNLIKFNNSACFFATSTLPHKKKCRTFFEKKG